MSGFLEARTAHFLLKNLPNRVTISSIFKQKLNNSINREIPLRLNQSLLKETLIKSGQISCEMKFVSFLIEKLAMTVAIGCFYSKNLAGSSLRKTSIKKGSYNTMSPQIILYAHTQTRPEHNTSLQIRFLSVQHL